ncbi:hypothetical protein CANINC_000906 [Pichia inconspicua]|uniref:Autophagy-related protein 16 domain-containing protein n=1 Tax=Pichia inconspicua TaxID=52247 RepID=A0A4T0X517_9ASCO|nr:hypothetical protein CANINC_000906 [[Candida] inconspicua]
MTSDWKREFRLHLAEAEAKRRENGVLNTIDYLNSQIQLLRERNEKLKHEQKVSQLDRALDTIKIMQEKIALQEQLLRDKEMVNNELIVAYGMAKKEKESTKEEFKKLEQKYFQLQEELLMGKKTIETINDHILELQLENNMLSKNRS